MRLGAAARNSVATANACRVCSACGARKAGPGEAMPAGGSGPVGSRHSQTSTPTHTHTHGGAAGGAGAEAPANPARAAALTQGMDVAQHALPLCAAREAPQGEVADRPGLRLPMTRRSSSSGGAHLRPGRAWTRPGGGAGRYEADAMRVRGKISSGAALQTAPPHRRRTSAVGLFDGLGRAAHAAAAGGQSPGPMHVCGFGVGMCARSRPMRPLHPPQDGNRRR